MTKYAICPRLFENCLANPNGFKNILLKFIQSNGLKILMDKEKTVLDRYSKLHDPNDFFGFWLNLLESNPSEAFYHVSTYEDIFDLPNEQAMVILAGSFDLERNIATVDACDYSSQLEKIKGLGINLIESHDILNHMDQKKTVTLDSNKLLNDLVDKAKILLEKKFSRNIEDIYNDEFSEYLRGRGYCACDQTRSGISPGGVNPGEIDIMIRSPNTGAPESIIESFILNSCGPDDTIISSHLSKLLSNYDTAGLGRNFVLIFSMLKDFQNAWKNYLSYTSELNSKKCFSSKHLLTKFTDISEQWSTPVNVRIGLAVHNRDGSPVEIFHIFINMCKS